MLGQQVRVTTKKARGGLREIEDRLRPLKTDLQTLGSKIGFDLRFPPQLVSVIYEYVKQASMLSAPKQRTSAELEDLIWTMLVHTREYRNRLKEVGDTYDELTRFWKEVSLQLVLTGSRSLARKLEEDYDGLVSQIGELLAGQKEGEFTAGIGAIRKGLAELRGLTARYMRQGTPWDAVQRDPEADEKWACRILGVPANASLSQIERVYRSLVAMWHPDAGLVTDEGRIKEIVWAFDLLRKKRGVRFDVRKPSAIIL